MFFLSGLLNFIWAGFITLLLMDMLSTLFFENYFGKERRLKILASFLGILLAYILFEGTMVL